MSRILLVEDDESLRQVLCTFLENKGFLVTFCTSAEEALESNFDQFDLVLTDYKLGEAERLTGLDLVKKIRAGGSRLPVLIMTAYGTIELAVEAIKFGANDFISKPFEPENLIKMMQQVIEKGQVLERSIAQSRSSLRTFLTRNPATLKILQQAKKVARVDSSILILGESGTGKEMLARLVHENSPRYREPFHAINSAAMPPELLESELFGHEAGSFTGATQTRIGLFEVASQGTIFLDEIGDMPAHLQVKLLRVLQEREIKRVGGNKIIKVNPRIISATNCNIEEALKDTKFREDLYYRLAVVVLKIPPLRERPEDLELLLNYFLQFFNNKHSKKATFNKSTFSLLKNYHWPGNARELENRIERAVLLADRTIEAEHLGIEPRLTLDLSSIKEATSLIDVASHAAQLAEVDLIVKTLARTSGNKTKAAEILGVSYKTLLNKIKSYHLEAANNP